MLSELESKVFVLISWMSTKGFWILCWMALFLRFTPSLLAQVTFTSYSLLNYLSFDFHTPMVLHPRFFYVWVKSWSSNSHIDIWFIGQLVDMYKVVCGLTLSAIQYALVEIFWSCYKFGRGTRNNKSLTCCSLLSGTSSPTFSWQNLIIIQSV